MAALDLAGVSDDGRRLLLVGQQGEEFDLEITPALRAAIRGEATRSARSTRPAALENQMTSTLRPREIQVRIRAGETPESVATAAQTTVDAIMPFIAPVLAERAHVAERAQKSSLRRPLGDGGSGTRVLGDAVATHLVSQQAKIDQVTWDAYRRDDGRWELTGTFATTPRTGTARFTFDGPGNYVVADNDDAKWLVGDLVVVSESPRRDDLQEARERRLAVVPAEELPLGDDVLDLVGVETEAAMFETPALHTPEPAPAHSPGHPSGDEPLRVTAHDDPALLSAPEEPHADDGADASRHRRPVAKKRGRASVPSWDEIMFGGSGD
ncbi:septation protein SepH [Nocardioides stalactiti]|uniref:septation protein SepH n=1 Tax=Nocardioides stalactiti TaxID=2755356 RepID=UPI001602A32E|nr:septation protein SepH [Nocardioides stalactiti]